MGKRNVNRKIPIVVSVLSLIALTIASCTKTGKLDLMSASVRFMDPTDQIYTNATSYNFQFQMTSSSKIINAGTSKMNLYEGAGCDSSHWVGTYPVVVSGLTASCTPLATLVDGKIYSADVTVDGLYQSQCSSSIVIDRQNPNAISFTYPTSDFLVGQTQELFSWTAVTDNGLSGLASPGYRIQLFSQANCGGTAISTVTSTDPQYTFTSLPTGTYSAQVVAIDKAGNLSTPVCSANATLDMNVPGFQLADATSSVGYSRVLTPTVTISNDATAASWCFTTNTSFVPSACTDACPGGGGTSNGWYTASPSTLTLASGDGLKTYNLWICNGSGTLISHNVSSGAITLDQTPPGNFSVTGIGGGTDTYFDAYLTSSSQPEIKWSTSTDAINYAVQILDGSNSVLCSQNGVTVLDYTFTGCPAFTDGQTYKIRVTSTDTALNTTTAPDFPFIVDRTPPGSFSITGITGGSDSVIDHWLGSAKPAVNYSSATGSTHYKVEVQDAGGSVVCTSGTKNDQSGIFDYNVEGGVTCSSLVNGQSYTAYVSALDDGQNETPAANNGYSFTIDTTAPTLNVDPVASPTDNPVTVTFTASDADSGLGTIQCRLDGGAYSTCTSPSVYTGLTAGAHTVDVKATDLAGNSSIASVSWTIYGYSWITSGFSACSAAQPAWVAGGFGACSAAQPAYTYGGWGSCSVTCGGGTQTRSQTCPVVGGTQTQTVTCPVNSGTETQTVQCQRSDSVIVADTFCNAGSKPPTSQSCTRGGGTDCSGTQPASSQACTRGGGSDCNSAQATSQSCNTNPCCSGTSVGGYCWYLGGGGTSCDSLCSGHGGNSAGTTAYAGASAGNCSAVLAAFGYGGPTSSACAAGYGCWVNSVSSGPYFCTSPGADTSAAYPSAARVCSCAY
jgi:hypothetical protein